MFGYQACHVCTQLEHVFLSRVHTLVKTTVLSELSSHRSLSPFQPYPDINMRDNLITKGGVSLGIFSVSSEFSVLSNSFYFRGHIHVMVAQDIAVSLTFIPRARLEQ